MSETPSQPKFVLLVRYDVDKAMQAVPALDRTHAEHLMRLTAGAFLRAGPLQVPEGIAMGPAELTFLAQSADFTFLTAMIAGRSTVQALMHQIEQMRGLFPDADGTIEAAMDEGRSYVKTCEHGLTVLKSLSATGEVVEDKDE